MRERIFRVTEQALDQITAQLQRQVRLLSYVLPGAGLLVMLGVGLARLIRWPVLLVLYPVFLIGMLIWLRLYLRVQQESWSSLRILLGDDQVTRHEAGRRDVVIRRDEMAGLVDIEDGPIVIQYKGGRKTLAIPREIEGFALIRARLIEWQEQ